MNRLNSPAYNLFFLFIFVLQEVNGYLPGMKYNFYHTVESKGWFDFLWFWVDFMR